MISVSSLGHVEPILRSVVSCHLSSHKCVGAVIHWLKQSMRGWLHFRIQISVLLVRGGEVPLLPWPYLGLRLSKQSINHNLFLGSHDLLLICELLLILTRRILRRGHDVRNMLLLLVLLHTLERLFLQFEVPWPVWRDQVWLWCRCLLKVRVSEPIIVQR